jgi:hypothetical protein
MPNLDPWVNKNNNKNEDTGTKTITDKFENDLLSIIDERQKMIRPNCHPTYNERHENIIEIIDWTLGRYKTKIKENNNEQVIINDIIEELAKKRDIAIHKKKQALFKDDVSIYRLDEDTIDYVLFRIRECTGKLV